MYYDNIYLRLGGGSVFYVPATIGESNFDARKGALFCRYEGILESEQLNGQQITEVGITIGQSMTSHICVDNVSYVKNKSKLVINVCLTINKDDNVRFFGADNVIAMAILGTIALPTADFEMCVTKNYLTNEVEGFDMSRVLDRKTASVSVSSGVFTVSSSFLTPIREVVVLFRGVPVLGFFPQTPVNVKVSSVLAQNAGSVILNEEDIVDVFSVAVDGNSVVAEVVPLPDAVSTIRTIIPKYGKNMRIESGVNDQNLLIDDFGVTLTRDFMPIRSFCGSDGRICANGAVVIFGEKVTIFDGEREIKLDIKSGVQNEAIFSGGIYLIVCFDGKYVRIHRVNSATFSVSSVVEQPGDVQIFPMFGTHIAAVTPTVCRVYAISGTNSSMTSWLLNNAYCFAGNKITFYGNKLVLFDGTNSTYIEYKLWDLNEIEGEVRQDFVIKFDGVRSFVSSIEAPSVNLFQIMGKICSFSRFGNKIFVLKDDGCVVVQLVNSKKTKLICDSIMSGSQVSYNVRYRMPIFGLVSGKLAIN